MPVDRHRIGAEPHHRIGRLDEGDVVAHQDADAVALPDAEPLQAAGDAAGAIGDLGVAAPALAADDAEEAVIDIVFPISVGLKSHVIPRSEATECSMRACFASPE